MFTFVQKCFNLKIPFFIRRVWNLSIDNFLAFFYKAFVEGAICKLHLLVIIITVIEANHVFGEVQFSV